MIEDSVGQNTMTFISTELLIPHPLVRAVLPKINMVSKISRNSTYLNTEHDFKEKEKKKKNNAHLCNQQMKKERMFTQIAEKLLICGGPEITYSKIESTC